MVKKSTNVCVKGHHALWPPTAIQSGGSSTPPPHTHTQHSQKLASMVSKLLPVLHPASKVSRGHVPFVSFICLSVVHPFGTETKHGSGMFNWEFHTFKNWHHTPLQMDEVKQLEQTYVCLHKHTLKQGCLTIFNATLISVFNASCFLYW